MVFFFYLRNKLDDTAGLLDLAPGFKSVKEIGPRITKNLLGLLGDVAGTDDDRDVGDATLAEDLAVAKGKEVENGGLVGALGLEVLVTLLEGDEGPELVEVDDRLPELLVELVEVTHADLSEITGMVLDL